MENKNNIEPTKEETKKVVSFDLEEMSDEQLIEEWEDIMEHNDCCRRTMLMNDEMQERGI